MADTKQGGGAGAPPPAVPEDVLIGGQPFTLQLLKFGQLKKVRRHLEVLFKYVPPTLPTEEEMDAMVVVIHASAQAFKPELTLEALMAIIDNMDYDTAIEDLAKAYMIVSERSGLLKTGGASPGEAPAAPAAASTSPGSTD